MIHRVYNKFNSEIRFISKYSGYYNTHFRQKKWTSIAIKRRKEGLPS